MIVVIIFIFIFFIFFFITIVIIIIRPHVAQGKGWFGGGADLTPYYLHDEDVRVSPYIWLVVC